MMTPAVAAHRLIASLAVGAALGFFYGFLRPLRPKLTALSDFIFVAATFYGWLYIGFGVCGGDLRFGCIAAMAVGGFAWEMSVGRWLRPLFRGFWKIISKTVGFFLLPLKKILEKIQKFVKFLLASWKKWFTIKNNQHSNHPRSGGTVHGKKKKSRHQAGVQEVQPHHQSRAVGGSGAVHHRAGDPPRLHRRKPQSV